MIMFHFLYFPSILGGLTALAPSSTPVFAAPFQLRESQLPINVDGCHAAPLYVDFDEDGEKELLVGQFGGGKLRIYENSGTDAEPVFEGFSWLKAGDEVASVPAG